VFRVTPGFASYGPPLAPLVTTKDHVSLLKECVNSVLFQSRLKVVLLCVIHNDELPLLMLFNIRLIVFHLNLSVVNKRLSTTE